MGQTWDRENGEKGVDSRYIDEEEHDDSEVMGEREGAVLQDLQDMWLGGQCYHLLKGKW